MITDEIQNSFNDKCSGRANYRVKVDSLKKTVT
jgi:hypothetical protein